MADNKNNTNPASDVDLDDLVASTDTGGRNPSNKFVANLIAG
jgi:hypothetical protein